MSTSTKTPPPASTRSRTHPTIRLDGSAVDHFFHIAECGPGSFEQAFSTPNYSFCQILRCCKSLPGQPVYFVPLVHLKHQVRERATNVECQPQPAHHDPAEVPRKRAMTSWKPKIASLTAARGTLGSWQRTRHSVTPKA